MGDLDGLRIVAVHAHPDDESIWTGLLLANAARRGAKVHVLTCTLGEHGEVIGDYQALVEDRTGLLGGYRLAELERALDALGAQPQPDLLGGLGRWRDSGMAGTSTIAEDTAFANPEREDNFTVQLEQLTDRLKELEPDLLVTYAPDGGYGHPDHIRAHHITHAAVESGALPSVKQILWARTVTQDVREGLEGAVVPEGWSEAGPGDIASVDASEIDFRVRGTEEDVATKRSAMAAHVTQVWMADGNATVARPEAAATPEGTPELWALSNLIAQPLLNTEAYAVGHTAEGVSDQYAGEKLASEKETEEQR